MSKGRARRRHALSARPARAGAPARRRVFPDYRVAITGASDPSRPQKFAIGQSVRRLKDPRLVEGLGRYSAELPTATT